MSNSVKLFNTSVIPMGSKERIQRLKEETRINILEAALEIVKEDGWASLSMRKIADKIEYTAPIIYEYFENKEGILYELTRMGNALLLQDLKAARAKHRKPEEQLEAMWFAYWDFAFNHKEYYQLMFGVEMICCAQIKSLPEVEAAKNMAYEVISQLITVAEPTKERIQMKYLTFWAVIHGLISINLVRKGSSNDQLNQHILKSAIQGIIKTIND